MLWQATTFNETIPDQADPIIWVIAAAFMSIIFFVAIVIGLWLRLANRRHHDLGGAVTYHGKKVLSIWEQRAIKTLMDQLSPELHLCPQVRLADIVDVESADRSAWRSAFNRIACKSVDFVVMDLLTGTPIMVIELDDRSHSRSDRRERDALVDRVLREASIPLVRFKPFGKLDIRPHLSGSEQVSSR